MLPTAAPADAASELERSVTQLGLAERCSAVLPIYLMFMRVLLSVEFCFTLKTYLKGAPFYNASAIGEISPMPVSG